MAYNEEDFLLLSGLQHFKFCRRQWAMIHVERQWADNERTVEGEIMHQTAHDPSFQESRGDKVTMRAVRVFSSTLGVTGECDVLEFVRDPGGISLPGREALWQPYPVEYKRGRPNPRTGDTLQLCGQAMCLEEMLGASIPSGWLYYGEIRRREPVEFTQTLRDEVRAHLAEMHAFYARGYTPKVKPSKSCQACSMKELCLPKLLSSRSVADYMRKNMEDAL